MLICRWFRCMLHAHTISNESCRHRCHRCHRQHRCRCCCCCRLSLNTGCIKTIKCCLFYSCSLKSPYSNTFHGNSDARTSETDADEREQEIYIERMVEYISLFLFVYCSVPCWSLSLSPCVCMWVSECYLFSFLILMLLLLFFRSFWLDCCVSSCCILFNVHCSLDVWSGCVSDFLRTFDKMFNDRWIAAVPLLLHSSCVKRLVCLPCDAMQTVVWTN